ncbi:MAG: glucosamine-6-phosphate deaminase [Peptococcaceae bacterium]|nr:glucosamine-6-phosphate deaminase [Peptococcaceae bacterium]
MRIFVAKDYHDLSLEAAKVVADEIVQKPGIVLGLATGATPLAMYRELIRMHREEGLDFSQVITFNLDEYIGLPPANINSYRYYMFHNFFRHINIKLKNTHLPNAMAVDVDEACQEYEQQIAGVGGIDLQVLGIGQNGHIGFNEPGVDFALGTHRAQLDEATIADNARFFASRSDVPRYAISLGIKSIMQAKKILLLASGNSKARAIYELVHGAVSNATPATFLKLHHDVQLILDEPAAMHISRA